MFDHAPPFQNSRGCATQPKALSRGGWVVIRTRTGKDSSILKFLQNVYQRPSFPFAADLSDAKLFNMLTTGDNRDAKWFQCAVFSLRARLPQLFLDN